MRHFAFRPSITIKGRENYGLRGFAGKPFHPPLTDIPVGAYVFAAVFDIISLAMGASSGAHALFLVSTWLILGGVVVSLLAALTGWADWHRSSEPGNQARRTINAHAIIMLSVTTIALVNLILRLTAFWGDASTPVMSMVLSIITAAAIAWGATYGGSLVFDYGFNVEVAGDSPVWATSEVDLLPGQHPADGGSEGGAKHVDAGAEATAPEAAERRAS
jgi:uncharacterized membrane protein